MEMKANRAAHVGVNFYNTVFLKAQLEGEITRLERQLESLRLQDDQMTTISLQQTFKEMIHSRRDMLNQLPH